MSYGPKFNRTDNDITEKNDAINIVKNVASEINVHYSDDMIDRGIRRNIDLTRGKICNIINETRSKKRHVPLEQKIFREKLKLTENFVKDNAQLLITIADKGNLTVCMDKNAYRQKCLDLLSDEETYVKVGTMTV